VPGKMEERDEMVDEMVYEIVGGIDRIRW